MRNKRLTRQYFIEVIGLYYNWWRWYGSEVGRYYETDSVSQVLPLSKYSHINMNFNLFSTYQYSCNNSVRYIDSNGQIPVPPSVCGPACVICLGGKIIKVPDCDKDCKNKSRCKNIGDYSLCMINCLVNPIPTGPLDVVVNISCAICIGCLLLQSVPIPVPA